MACDVTCREAVSWRFPFIVHTEVHKLHNRQQFLFPRLPRHLPVCSW